MGVRSFTASNTYTLLSSMYYSQGTSHTHALEVVSVVEEDSEVAGEGLMQEPATDGDDLLAAPEPPVQARRLRTAA
jgi:hypothetical protein